jgi:hypothetical protein
MEILFQTPDKEPPGEQATLPDCVQGPPPKASDPGLDVLADLELLVQEEQFPSYYRGLHLSQPERRDCRAGDFPRAGRLGRVRDA